MPWGTVGVSGVRLLPATLHDTFTVDVAIDAVCATTAAGGIGCRDVERAAAPEAQTTTDACATMSAGVEVSKDQR